MIAKTTRLAKEDFTSEFFARLVSFVAFVKGLRSRFRRRGRSEKGVHRVHRLIVPSVLKDVICAKRSVTVKGVE